MMADAHSLDHDEDLVELAKMSNPNFRAFQCKPGGLFICRVCDTILDPKACSETENIESYECRCESTMTSLEVYQDIGEFNRVMAQLKDET